MLNFSVLRVQFQLLCKFQKQAVSSTSTSGTKSINKILFLGNDNFSLESLRVLIELFSKKSGSSITVVVSNENNLIGKFSKKAEPELELNLVNWKDFKAGFSPGERERQRLPQFDLGVVASFGHLIPETVIGSCASGILNVHGSLLPKYRGAAPTAAAIINGDPFTGVSIMRIAPKKFDIGPILYQKKVPLHPHIRNPELIQYLALVGAKALKKVVLNLDHYLSISTSQEKLPEKPSLAPKLTPDLGIVDWDCQNADQIYNLYRGLYGSMIKLKTFYNGKLIDLDSFAMIQEQSSESETSNFTIGDGTELLPKFSFSYSEPVTVYIPEILEPGVRAALPGSIYLCPNSNILCVKCSNSWIGVRKIKISTKWMSPKDFYNGYLSKLSKNVEAKFESKICSNLENMRLIK